MRILIKSAEFREALALVGSIVPKNTPKPILQDLLVEAGEDGTTLCGTDLEIGLRRRVLGVLVERPGRCVLPRARLGQFLACTRDVDLALEVEGGVSGRTLVVHGRQARLEFPVADPAIYPDVPRFEPGPFHSVRAADLATLFRRTAFAADDDLSSRYFLDGVLIEPDRAHAALVGVATDGRRIARQIIPAVLGEAPDVARRTLLPSKAVRLFGRLLGPDDDLNVHLRLGERSALLRTDRAEASARLVEGRFPRYEDVFPDRCVHRATTTVEDLKEAIGAALVTTAIETRGIDFVLAERGCVLRSAAADRGKGEVTLALGYEGPVLTITLDGEFLLQCLKILPATQAITLEVPADGRTLVLTGADRYHYLQCPIVNVD